MGRDKATLPAPDPGPGAAGVTAAGVTMVERTVAVLAARCRPVFVVAAARQPLPDLGAAHVLRDEVVGQGPLPATGLGLRAAAAAGCEWAFVCAVDMPGLSVDLVSALTGALTGGPGGPYCGDETGAVLACSARDGRDHYLAAVYRTALAQRVDALVAAGERSMRALAGTVPTRRVAIVDAAMLANMNTPAGDGAG